MFKERDSPVLKSSWLLLMPLSTRFTAKCQSVFALAQENPSS